MALFGKKKSETSAPASSSSTPAPAETSAFDFDAISRDLDAHNGASSFDALLSQPAGATQTNSPPVSAPPATESAFDFPEGDPLQVATPAHPVVTSPLPSQVTTETVASEAAPVAPLPESVINEPLSPPVVVDTTPSAPSPVPVEVPVGRVRPAFKTKKPFPLVPVLGALGALACLGGATMFLLNSQKEPLDDATPASVPVRPRIAKRPPVALAPVQANAVAPRPAVAAPRPAIVVPPGQKAVVVLPGQKPVVVPLRSGRKAVVVPAVSLRSGSPGIAPPVSNSRPVGAARPNGASQIPVRIAQSATAPRPVTKTNAPSATAGLDVGLASRLKALWRAGADAKHRRNFKEARASWEEALRLRPGHPGFAEAIAKLPK